MPSIGPYELTTIETGYFGLDGGAMFGVVPKPLWEKRMVPDSRNRIRLAMRCLLLTSSERVILIDNGLGHKYTDKFASLYAVEHESHTLASSLATAGVGFGDVTDVVLTHLHFDHAGGSTIQTAEGLKPAFPNASFHVQRQQWQSAGAPNAREAPSFLAENLVPIEESGRLVLHDGVVELFDGVILEPYFGHTESMQTVRIRHADRTLVFAADLLPTSHHLAPAWTMAYDIRPLRSMDEKAGFLQRAVNEQWSLFFEHDPDVVVADVVSTEKGPAVTNPRSLEEL